MIGKYTQVKTLWPRLNSSRSDINRNRLESRRTVSDSQEMQKEDNNGKESLASRMQNLTLEESGLKSEDRIPRLQIEVSQEFNLSAGTDCTNAAVFAISMVDFSEKEGPLLKTWYPRTTA
jgi:hypothetical protein